MFHDIPAPSLRRRGSQNLAAAGIAFLGNWLRRMGQHGAARRDARFLMSQPDHILRDIGIGRSEIERAVRGTHRG